MGRCEDLPVVDAALNSVKENNDNRMTPVIWHTEVTTMKTKTAFLSVFGAQKSV